ncbi:MULTISPECIES: hypothetical protein [unclassified Beijerinckia]|uniref:ATP-dependent DNA ligase n=1 Tax=unclassified Beijerinckia TaxID=2638183 RepID=UPI00089484E8|nr:MULTISPECIES: hypothetical protein [unclassified Beijerinckia]MDH7796468.1 DNA ligase-1 [Beijerinckia sp. GAS462]SEC46445.1 ATP dependent DNA ligase domain-containing protein [Beijerinckia sp. 28-YEA-48]
MISEPIYKRDSKQNIRTWAYEVEGDKWRTHAGILDGNLVVSGWTIAAPKSKDTAEEQAQFEADAERSKKLARDYRLTIGEVDRPRDSVIKPMLAEKYTDFPSGHPHVFSQPKLDGIRCIATKEGLWSRQGKPILSCPHVSGALSGFFALAPSLILDGELYGDTLSDDFNKITSLVKKQKPTDADLAESARLIQYHIYDVPSVPGSFFMRLSSLRIMAKDFSTSLKMVPTGEVSDAAALNTLYGQYLEAGYEGQMVRLNGDYEQKRSKQLLKRKEFQDAEFEVVRLEEGLGNWAGYAKKVTLKLADGREFGAGIKGDQAYTKALLGTSPTTATVRYFTPTPDGIPRFPVAVAFHEGERL